MATNVLYLVVLPMVHLGASQFGLTEQVITLMTSRESATEFFPDEVQEYLDLFDRRTQYLTGGHVSGYSFEQIKTDNNRVVVRVYQHVL